MIRNENGGQLKSYKVQYGRICHFLIFVCILPSFSCSCSRYLDDFALFIYSFQRKTLINAVICLLQIYSSSSLPYPNRRDHFNHTSIINFKYRNNYFAMIHKFLGEISVLIYLLLNLVIWINISILEFPFYFLFFSEIFDFSKIVHGM